MLNRIDSWGGGGWVWVRWLGREGRRTGGRHEYGILYWDYGMKS